MKLQANPLALVVLIFFLLTQVLSFPVAAQPAPDFLTFESGPVRPLALAPNRARLFVVNTPDNRLEIFDVRGPLRHVASVPVGLEPVAVAARTNTEVWVVNHLSDSVSIVDVAADPPRVTRTLLVGDEPRDLVFGLPAAVLPDGTHIGGRRAFVTTAHRGQHREHASLAGVPGAGDPQLTTPGIGRADVWVFDTAETGDGLGGTPLAILELFGDTPRALAVSPDGSLVYAAVFFSGNRTTVVPEGTVCDGFRPTDNPNACPGEFPGAPGGLPGPATNHTGVPAPEVGLIVRFDPRSGEWRDELGRDWSAAVRFDLPDLDVFALDATTLETTASFAGVGTVLFNMAVHPRTGKIFVSNTEARNEVRFEGRGEFTRGETLQARLHQSRVTILDPGGTGAARVQPRHLNKHLDYRRHPTPASMARHSLSKPTAVAFSGDGSTLYVAAFGSSKIGVFPSGALERNTFDPAQLSARYIEVNGGGPAGLALDAVRGRLFVATRFDNGVSEIDLDAQQPREVAHVTLHNPEPRAVVAGRPLIYDARVTSSNGEASCGVCHVFGDLDGLAWDLGDPDGDVGRSNNVVFFEGASRAFSPPVSGTGSARDFHPMKGPMTTQTLRGMRHHGSMHWRGDRADGIFGNNPLDAGLSLRNFAVAFEALLGRGAPLSERSMRRFSGAVLPIVLPPNPVAALDRSTTQAQQDAFNVFQTRSFSFDTGQGGFSCRSCHTLDPGSGFFGTSGRQAFNGQPQIFKNPHLRNLYQKVGMFGMADVDLFDPGDNGHQGDQVRGFGFLHDGSVDTLERFLKMDLFGFRDAATGFADDAERRDMVDFLLAFDTDLAPIVGQQITLGPESGGDVDARLDLLAQRASTPFASRILGGPATDCDLVVHGVFGGTPRGALFDPAADVFRTDRESDPPLTLNDLRALATEPGQALTFTCAPPGSGRRMALDRDRDGALDGDERVAGTDPADPRSRPLSASGLSLTPESRNFGEWALGQVSTARRVRVRNESDRRIVIGKVRIGGANRGEFQLRPAEDGCSDNRLDPGMACDLLPRFAPNEEGSRRGLLIVPVSSGDGQQLVVPLRGAGVR